MSKMPEKTILLVEDETITALLQKTRLEGDKYRVFHADTGEKAVEIATQDDAIDLILMDIDLGPGIDGAQAAQEILKIRQVPLLFLSSHTEKELVDRTKHIPSYGYIVKNSDFAVLSASIKMAFKLYELKSLYQDTYEYSINGLCTHKMLYDENGKPFDCMYMKVNSSFEKHTGLSPEAVQGKTIRDFYSHEEANDVITMYAMVLESGKPYQTDFFFKPTSTWYHLSIFPMKNDEFTVIIENINEKKEIEKIRAESELHYRTLANAGQALIWTSGIDGGCNYFNQVWLDFTGKTEEEEKGDGWTKDVHPDDLDFCWITYKTAFEKKEKFNMEYRLKHADGSWRWIHDMGSPRYDSDGNFLGYIGHCLDISAKKEAEKTL
jgi:PAS domain S-box-containing protein